MLHGYLGDAKFWRILLRIDEEWRGGALGRRSPLPPVSA